MKITNLNHYLIAFCLLCISGITACSDKNDSPEIPNVPENPNQPNNPEETTDSELYKSYNTTTNDLISLIKNDGISTNSELVEVAKNYDNFVSAEEIEGIQYLYFKGNLEFFVDFNEECSISSEDDIDTDDSELNNLIEELDNFYSSPINYLSSKASSSQATNHINYCATSKKILLWCPLDLETESSSINTQINEAIKALKNPTYSTTVPWSVTIKLGNECSASDFKTFDQYDIVFVIVHGSIKGEPMVSKSFNVKMGSKGIIGKNSYNILSSQFLSDNLPSMPHTVIWTLMCHSISENSAFASVAEAKSVGDFFGASNNVDVSTSIGYFKPFYLRLGLGMNSYEAFSPEGKNFYNYSINTSHGIKEGVFGHNDNLNGVCFPLQHVRTAENEKPIGVWQTSIGVMAKVKNNNGPFKAGIKLENVDTGESTIKEMSDDNIDSSESKKFGDFFEETTYTFKTDGLKPGTYNYRTYITYPDGTTQYSENQETFIAKSNPILPPNSRKFEIICESEDDYSFIHMFFSGKDINILHVECDESSDFWWESYHDVSIHNDIHLEIGIYNRSLNPSHLRIYYAGEIISLSQLKGEEWIEDNSYICGGILPDEVRTINSFFDSEKIKIKKISSTEYGNYTLTIPQHIDSINFGWSSLEVADFSDFNNLRWISLSGDKLKDVNLSNCNNLEEISLDSPNLEIIKLNNSTNIKRISGFNHSKHIASLAFLNDCPNIEEIGYYAVTPSWIWSMTTFRNLDKLYVVDFSGLKKLKKIERDCFRECKNLKEINFSGLTHLKEIPLFWDCENLKTINLSGTGIEKFGVEGNGNELFVDSLLSLNLSGCPNLRTLGNKSLFFCKHIDVSNCPELSYIRIEWDDLLDSIDMSGCDNLLYIDFDRCSKITHLSINKSVIYIGNTLTNPNLQNVYCYPLTPPEISRYYDINPSTHIYVPAQSLEKYQERWGIWEYENGIRTCVNIFPM